MYPHQSPNPQHRPHDPIRNPMGYGEGHYYRTRKFHPIVIVGLVFAIVLVVAVFFTGCALILLTSR